MNNFDLNSVCRFFEVVACITFIASFLIMFVGLCNGNALSGVLIGLGGIVTSAHFMFISKLGDAVDDIRNKYVYNE